MRARALAFYLPQFHPTPENDQWWGPGFTEWTNVATARPLFRGHEQPIIPGELGFYDLRLPETRAAQAELAALHGVEGFVYYHYWFAGRRLLHHVFDDVLSSGHPALPFALAWANQSWSGVWHGNPDRVLVEQTYPGREDHARHFAELLPAFSDARYIRVDGKPLFYVYAPNELPSMPEFCDLWRGFAQEAGLPGLHLVGEHKGFSVPTAEAVARSGFDAMVPVRLPSLIAPGTGPLGLLKARLRGRRYVAGRGPTVYDYASVATSMVPVEVSRPDLHPCVVPNWDNTARAGRRGRVLANSTPEAFRSALERAVDAVGCKQSEQRLVFLKSWNEWAEGNVLEPDRVHERAYLDAVAQVVGFTAREDARVSGGL